MYIQKDVYTYIHIFIRMCLCICVCIYIYKYWDRECEACEPTLSMPASSTNSRP